MRSLIFSNDLHDVRRIEIRLALRGQLRHDLLEHDDAVGVQAAHRLVEEKDVRIVQEARDDQHLLLHALAVRGILDV